MNLAFKTFDSSGEGRLSKDDVRRVLGRCMVLSEEELSKVRQRHWRMCIHPEI